MTLALNQVHCIDAVSGLKKLADESVDCVMTSPSYWATRDYGIPPSKWSDGSEVVLGLEKDVGAYVRHLLEVFSEIRRVLKPKGTCWVNLGDTYAGSWGNYAPHRPEKTFRRHVDEGSTWERSSYSDPTFRPPSSYRQSVPARCLCLVPERIVLGMVEQGWILRNRICWHKTNGMPSSVKNRLRSTWEHLLFFTKQPSKYYFDLDAIREPHKCLQRAKKKTPSKRLSPHVRGNRMPPSEGEPNSFHARGKNPGDFWEIAASVRKINGQARGVNGVPAIPHGKGWIGYPQGGEARIVRENDTRWLSPNGKNPGDTWLHATGRSPMPGHFAVYPEKFCERPIKAGCPERGIVLDPFAGTGTTLAVAKRLGRQFIGFELSPEYVEMANIRLQATEEPPNAGEESQPSA